MKDKEYIVILNRISELENEYFDLEISWKKEKTFKKLDRKYEIELIFRELGIELNDWTDENLDT